MIKDTLSGKNKNALFTVNSYCNHFRLIQVFFSLNSPLFHLILFFPVYLFGDFLSEYVAFHFTVTLKSFQTLTSLGWDANKSQKSCLFKRKQSKVIDSLVDLLTFLLLTPLKCIAQTQWWWIEERIIQCGSQTVHTNSGRNTHSNRVSQTFSGETEGSDSSRISPRLRRDQSPTPRTPSPLLLGSFRSSSPLLLGSFRSPSPQGANQERASISSCPEMVGHTVRGKEPMFSAGNLGFNHIRW